MHLVLQVRTLPESFDELRRVWGMGPKRVQQHGALMLEARTLPLTPTPTPTSTLTLNLTVTRWRARWPTCTRS